MRKWEFIRWMPEGFPFYVRWQGEALAVLHKRGNIMGLLLCKILLGILIFFSGSCIFSFLNVVIYRLPRNLNFVTGRSICPACGQRLGVMDLVPVFSYVFLRGRCRYCKEPIPARDTFVEILGGVLGLICVWNYGLDAGRVLLSFAFFSVLAVVAFIDIDTMEIYDGCHIAVIILALAGLFIMPEVTVAQRLLGAVCVSVPFLLTALAVPGAFGGGDIKLMAACGLFLGWKITLVSAAVAILLGGSYGVYLLALKKKDRKEHFAFGPFLCMGMAAGLLWGQQVIDWYTGFLLY